MRPALITVALAITLSACAGQRSVDELRAAVEELRASQTACAQAQVSQRQQLEALRDELRALDARQRELAESAPKQPTGPAKPARPSDGRPTPEEIYAVSVGDSPMRGAADAWVTVVEMSDFECPYCARVTPTLLGLLKKYGDDLRIVFKHLPLPFHSRAMPAAIAGECAHAQGRFWPLHDLLFNNPRRLDDEKIFAYVRQAGRIDFAQWQECFAAATPSGRIAADTTLAETFGVRGTPSFFVNGRFLSGAQPASAFEAIIDAELVRARASGIPRAEYYRRAVLDKGRPGP